MEWLPLVPWRLGPGSEVAGSSRNVLPSWVCWLVGNTPELVCTGSQGLLQGARPEASWRGWAVEAGQDGHRSAEEPGSSASTGHWRPSGFALAFLTCRRCQWEGKEETRQVENTKRLDTEPLLESLVSTWGPTDLSTRPFSCSLPCSGDWGGGGGRNKSRQVTNNWLAL